MQLLALTTLLVVTAAASCSAGELLRVPLAKRRAPASNVRLREGEGSVTLHNYLDAQVRDGASTAVIGQPALLPALPDSRAPRDPLPYTDA